MHRIMIIDIWMSLFDLIIHNFILNIYKSCPKPNHQSQQSPLKKRSQWKKPRNKLNNHLCHHLTKPKRSHKPHVFIIWFRIKRNCGRSPETCGGNDNLGQRQSKGRTPGRRELSWGQKCQIILKLALGWYQIFCRD